MRKYFTPYLENLDKYDKGRRIALGLATLGMLLFLTIAITIPFKDALFQNLFPKDLSKASGNDIISSRKMQTVNYFLPRLKNSTACDPMSYWILLAMYTDTDRTLANERIVNMLDNPDCGIIDAAGKPLHPYPTNTPLWSVYLDPVMNSRLTPEAKNAIRTMMWRTVNNRSTLPLANRLAFDQIGTENHNAIHSTSIFLALQALHGAPGYGPNKRLADGNTIDDHYNAWLGYWMRYFQERGREGLIIEFSPTYARITLPNFYPIRDYAKSQALKRQAQAFLDLYWADVAQEFIATGIRGGAQSRTYKLVPTVTTGYSLRHWLAAYDWFGNSWISPASDRFSLLAMVSPYNPPDILRSFVRDTNKPPYSYISRRFGLLDPIKKPIYNNNENLITVDGGSSLKRYTYVTPEYVLGTHQYDSAKTYSVLTNQNRLMGVFFKEDDNIDSRIVVLGKVKDNFRCGVTGGYREINGIAGPNTMVVARDPKVDARANIGTRIYIHNGKLRDNLSKTPEDGWLFTRNDKAFVAIRIASGAHTQTDGIFFAEQAAPANDDPVADDDNTNTTTTTCLPQSANGLFVEPTDIWSPIIIQLGRATDYPSFESFKTKVKGRPFSYVNNVLSYKSLNGDLFEYWANNTKMAQFNRDWNRTPGENINPKDTYNSPYLKQVHGEGKTTMTYGGQSITINTDCILEGSDDCSAINGITPDKTPPTVKITDPTSDEFNSNNVRRGDSKNFPIILPSGITQEIKAMASDASGIKQVEFLVEKDIVCIDTSAPYSCTWNASTQPNIPYTLRARARDVKGNVAIAVVFAVTLGTASTPTPTINPTPTPSPTKPSQNLPTGPVNN